MFELYQLKSRITAADMDRSLPLLKSSPPAALQGRHYEPSPPPVQAAAVMPIVLPPLGFQMDSVADLSAAEWPSLLQQIQNALTPEAAASIRYFRDMAFAAALCGEYSDSHAAEGALADAAIYTATSKQLFNIVAGQASPTPAQMLAALIAQVKHELPQIESTLDAATIAKEYSKAAELQALR
jgi:hypothetical protein